MSIFSSANGSGCEGGVLRVDPGKNCGGDTIATIKVENFNLDLPITGYALDLGTNHQFLHSLDNFIYLYAFGDRIGELTLTGIAFTGSCISDTAGNPLIDQTSQCNLLSYYADNRVSSSKGPTAVKISLSQCENILIGFLTGMRLDVPNPALPIVQWVLRYNVIFLEDDVRASAARLGGVGSTGGRRGGGTSASSGLGGPGGSPRYPSWPNFSWPKFEDVVKYIPRR